MNKHSTLFLSIGVAAFLLYSAQSLAVVPVVDGKGVPAVATCPEQTGVKEVAHFDKIIFMITSKLLPAGIADSGVLKMPLNTELDIKVRDDPRTVADLKGKILTFLGAADSVQSKNRSKIRIINVEYAVICANPVN